MAEIKKLQIQGIRSFGPSQEDRQNIDFFSPLTLILGQNGCGKTTIIECLKYVTTGDVPPGSNKGSSFIHDPKMAREMSVKGQVKLLFTCKANNGVSSKTITRSMEAAQKLKNITVKTLDSTIKTKHAGSEQVTTLSSKCMDTNLDMLLSLGVSRPILNYVIFCHQEDSNWPLEEGGKVKDKFDEIFNSAKYQKCLKNIKDVRKVEMDKAKMHKKDMEHYKSDKEYADSKATELSGKRDDLERIEETVARLDSELRPLVEELQKLSEEEKGFAEVQKKLTEAESGYKHIRKEREELEKQITEILPDSMDEDEIQRKRDGVLQETKRKEKELQEQEEAKEEQDERISGAEMGIQKNAASLGKAIAELEQHNQNVKEKNNQVELAAEKFGLDNDTEGCFISVLEREEKKVASKINKMRANNKENTSKIDDEIDSLKSAKTGLEERKKREQSDMMAQKKEIAIIKRQLNELDGAAEKLEKIQSDWEEAGQKLQREKSKYDLKSMAEEVEREKETVRELDNKEREVREELKLLEEKQGLYQKISHYDEDINTKEARVNKIMKKRRNDFSRLFGDIPDNKRLKNRFKDLEESNEKQLREFESKKATLDAESKAKRNLRKETKTVLDKNSSRIQTLEEKIGDILGLDENLEEEIAKVQEDLEQARMEFSVKEAKKFTNRENIEMMNKNKTDPACPLCQRKFHNKNEAKELIEELEEEINSIPNKVKNLKAKVTKLQDKLEGLQKMRPHVHELENLYSETLTQAKKIGKIDTEMKNFKKDIEDMNEEHSFNVVNNALLKEVSEDVQAVDSLTREIASLKEKKEEVSSNLEGSRAGRNIEEVKEEVEDITKNLRAARANKDKCQEIVSGQTSLINDLESKRNALTEKKLSIEGQQQKRTNMMEKKEELEKKVKDAETEVNRCKGELEPILEQLEETEERKRKAVLEGEKEVDKIVQLQREMEKTSSNLQKLQKSIESFLESGQQDKMNNLKKEKTILERNLADLKMEKETSEKRISKLKVEVSNQESRKRIFTDNLKLREYKDKETKYQTQIKAKEMELEDMNWKSVLEKKNTLNSKYNKITSDKSAKGGQIAEVRRTIKDMERELNNPKLKNAASMFKEMSIKHKLSLKAAEDLDKYYRALDFAIMKFHKEKMKVINKIIRELWRSTYKGNDIDYIEIKTTEDNEVSSGADKRKTYNYRVVMSKNGSELDMRGRCSAGQKVLSSLIIRLALAETFSTNCGIIALDEPTTNLDRENIDSLATALSEIVTKRSGQRNFQLVVITHDEEFIDELSRGGGVQHYQKVSRDKRGLSQIRKIAITD